MSTKDRAPRGYPQEGRGESPAIELRFSLRDPPDALADLPEPLRALAVEQANRLVAEGAEPDDAVRRAVEQAKELGHERIPTSRKS